MKFFKMDFDELINEARSLKYNSVSLQEDQLIHFINLTNIFLAKPFYIDYSSVGRGKTYISLFLSQYFDFPIIIFTTKKCLSVWIECAKLMGILKKNECENYKFKIFSYSSLTGKKNTKNDPDSLLLRENVIKIDKDNKTIQKVNYSCTKKALELLKNSLVIFDEFHKIIGESLTFNAVCILSDYIRLNKINRVGYLSSTPIDNIQKLIRFYRLVGIICFNKNQDLVSHINFYFKQFDISRVDEIFKMYYITNRNIIVNSNNITNNNDSKELLDLYQNLFVGVIKPCFSSKMDDFDIKCNYWNGLFSMTPEEEIYYLNNVHDITNDMAWNGTEVGKSNLLLCRILKNIEMSKLGIFYRQIRKSLEQERKKVVVLLNYISTAEALRELILSYKYAIIQGSTKDKDREEIIKIFQEPNDKIQLLIISSTKVSSKMSLHDCNKDKQNNSWPRDVYISPSFQFVDTLKFIGCFLRVDSLSVPNIYFVYPKIVDKSNIEQSIISSSHKKAIFSKKINNIDIINLSSFPKYIEPDK
jgi:superfamily II DNA or RNA helicase